MTFELVLSRLNEDINWIAAVPNDFVISIYNFKEKPVSIPRSAMNFVIKDAGQESAGYCEHIIRNWDNLADITVFSQACPHDHIANQGKSFITLLECVLKNPPTAFHFLGDRCHSSSEDPLVRRVWLHHTPNPAMPPYSKAPLKDACKYLLDQECPPKLELPFGAIFAAPRDTIKKHSLEFYYKLHHWNAHAPKTVEAAILEKIWPIILQ